jgi:hypothetical protein
MNSVSASRMSKMLFELSEAFPDGNGSPKLLLIEAANKMLHMQSELISCYKKIAEMDALTDVEYQDIDHGGEVKS